MTKDSTDHIQAASVATVDFERDLEDLVLSAYGRGAAIERTWEITVPLSDAPDWIVHVQKVERDDAADDESVTHEK